MEMPFSIGAWKVEPALNRVTGTAGIQSVEPRAMRVLVFLVHAYGTVVTREALLTEVWAGTVVTEHSLTIAISDLRKLFGDDPAAPSYIETVRGVGYRIVAPVTFDVSDDRQHSRDPINTKPIYLWLGVGVITLVVLFIAFFGSTFFSQPRQAGQLQSIKPLTTLPGVEISPDFSPDGERVVFVAFTESGTPADLYVQQLDADAPVQLTDLSGAELLPTWSPDGQWIAFQHYGPNGCALYKVPSIGGMPVKIRDITCLLAGLKWTPDGTGLIYAASEGSGRPVQLFMMAFENLQAVPISTPPPTIRGDVSPTVSQDGSRVAFLRAINGSAGDLYVLDLDESNPQPRKLSHDGVSITGFDWTREGQALLFASNREQRKGIWKIDIDGIQKPVLIQAISVEDPGSVTLARRGEEMVYVDWTFQVNTWRKSLHAAEDGATPLLQSTRIDEQPDISVGGRIAFVSTRTGSSEIWIADPDGGNQQKRTALRQHGTSYPRWSPDGRWIVFQSNNESQSDLYLIDATGGEPRLLTDTASLEVHPFWSFDGHDIYFGSDRSGRWQIWRKHLNDSTAEQITQTGGIEAQLSPDGATLYYTKPEAQGIWKKTLPGGEETCFINQPVLDWALTSRALYTVSAAWKKGALEVNRYELATGLPAEVTTIPMNPAHLFFSRGFAVSPDEAWFLYSQVDNSESNLMLATGSW